MVTSRRKAIAWCSVWRAGADLVRTLLGCGVDMAWMWHEYGQDGALMWRECGVNVAWSGKNMAKMGRECGVNVAWSGKDVV